MNLKLQLPKLTDLKPRITVIGIGGAGGNAVNNMIASGLEGVQFVVANTDAQALAVSSAEHRIQLGINLTEGLGAGSKPEIGEAAAEEAIDDIRAQISGCHMVFIAAGMGGGTGTGAAAVIARIAKEAGVLVVGVVTKPFQFEGARRMRVAEAGIAELKKHVDTLIVIPNQNLFRISSEKTTFAEAFVLADQVLYSGIACIVDLIVKEGLINLDFADVRTVMSGMGTAMMGTGEASGERRALVAAEEAIANPLLDDISLHGAKGLLVSIIGGKGMTLFEVDEAASRIRQEVDSEANIIVGATFDEALGERVRVSIVASGMARQGEPAGAAGHQPGLSRLSPQAGHGAVQGHAAPRIAPAGKPGAPQFQPLPAVTPMPAAAAPTAPPVPPAQGKPLSAALADAENQMPPLVMPAQSQSQPRETWRGPGDVTIETGLPPGLTQPSPALPPVAAPRPDARVDVPPVQPPAFNPAAPVEPARTSRRMPDVDDFPLPAQREYRAKVSGHDGHAPQTPPPVPRVYNAQQPAPVPRKKGLFERLTGIGRRRDEEHRPAPASAPRHPERHRYPQQQPPQPPSREDMQRRGNRQQEQVDLPVFFNRERS